MKQLQLRDGDLVLGSDGFATVEGARRLTQDLGCAVREEIGTDRFHPKWGTVLGDFVGRRINPETAVEIKAEVARVLQNYIVIQNAQIAADITARVRSRYQRGDIIDSVPSITTQQKYDRINVKAVVSLSSGQTVTVVRTVEG